MQTILTGVPTGYGTRVRTDWLLHPLKYNLDYTPLQEVVQYIVINARKKEDRPI